MYGHYLEMKAVFSDINIQKGLIISRVFQREKNEENFNETYL